MGNLRSDGKAIFIVFIGLIITVVFLGSIADSVFSQTTTFSRTNFTTAGVATNNSLVLLGRELVPGTTPLTWNATNGTDADNLQGVGVFVDTRTINGVRTVALTINQTGDAYSGATINVTYEYRPDGYLNNAGTRSISTLVIIISALALVVFTVVVFIKFGFMGQLVDGMKNMRRS